MHLWLSQLNLFGATASRTAFINLLYYLLIIFYKFSSFNYNFMFDYILGFGTNQSELLFKKLEYNFQICWVLLYICDNPVQGVL